MELCYNEDQVLVDVEEVLQAQDGQIIELNTLIEVLHLVLSVLALE